MEMAGFKDRYYRAKFGGKIPAVDVAKHYAIGLAWVMQYYFHVRSLCAETGIMTSMNLMQP